MWEVWRCPYCKQYYEEIAINEHKEVCHGRTTPAKDLPKGRVQDEAVGEGRIEPATGNRREAVL